jgi:hypothetical protein
VPCSCRDLAERLAAISRAQAAPTTAREAQQQNRISQLTDKLDRLTATTPHCTPTGTAGTQRPTVARR